jgi:hypothetical protein
VILRDGAVGDALPGARLAHHTAIPSARRAIGLNQSTYDVATPRFTGHGHRHRWRRSRGARSRRIASRDLQRCARSARSWPVACCDLRRRARSARSRRIARSRSCGIYVCAGLRGLWRRGHWAGMPLRRVAHAAFAPRRVVRRRRRSAAEAPPETDHGRRDSRGHDPLKEPRERARVQRTNGLVARVMRRRL